MNTSEIKRPCRSVLRLTRRAIVSILILLSCFSLALARTADPRFSDEHLSAISGLVKDAIRSGKTPGAVVLIGDQDRIIYKEAFGNRSIQPHVVPMTIDTIFDIASLTKAVATTTAIMQLIEKGKIDLDHTAKKYWPEFGRNGKSGITVRHLLTHYSGLRADLDLKPAWSGYTKAMSKIIRERPISVPGSTYNYSDINFEVLGEIIQRVTGEDLDRYCARNIFRPLSMKDTGFKPETSVRSRIAPTQFRNKQMLCGEVHDPNCWFMGGVAGHAGLFSTADDLAVFARMLLRGGSLNNVRILSSRSVDIMTTPQSPRGGKKLRGLGWDLEAPLAANREELPSVGAYGHLGYTGTALWIDPVTGIYVIVLTNRVHPDGNGDVKDLRAGIKKAVAGTFGRITFEQVLARRSYLEEFCSSDQICRGISEKERKRVRVGIDVLGEERFSPLRGMRVGLITNHTGLDSAGRRTLDLLYKAEGIRLKALFSPEHGLAGTADEKIRSSRERTTGLPVYSLYGKVLRPTDDMLKGLDALVFDIQDAGVRFYTYISTMGYEMEAASKKGLKFIVLDRPNPINASYVQGPVLDRDMRSFTGYFPLPVRHGMTVGELASMFNVEGKIKAQLKVIRMKDYSRSDWFDDTGKVWINPSPNLRSLTQATLYPGVALVEGANVSVGRGTGSPFELFGAPWINRDELVSYLNGRRIKGVSFEPADFTPQSDIYEGRLCHGTRLRIEDRNELDASVLGIEIVGALYRLYPNVFEVDKTVGMIGSRNVLQKIKKGQDPAQVALSWQDSLEEFKKIREKYLLY